MSGQGHIASVGGEIDELRALVECRLAGLVSATPDAPERLTRSMRHSLLAPAKRVRALIALLSAGHHGARREAALDAACAVEMVHAASLVLDDLPAMDDSGVRRGLPANHIVFGEGTAILAAIGLMNRAFAVAAGDQTMSAAARLAVTATLAWSIGEDGLIAGQEQDLHGKDIPARGARGEALPGGEPVGDVDAIELMHGRKTGALFAAAAEIGAIAADADDPARARARDFGWTIGTAFQTFDDLLDRYAGADTALKDTRKDDAKPTVVSLLGPAAALARARAHMDRAVALYPAGPSSSALIAYVGGLGGELMARLDRSNLDLVDGVSGN